MATAPGDPGDSYYTLHIIWQQRDYFAVYVNGDPDRLMMQDKQIVFHPDVTTHRAWATEQNIQLADTEPPAPHDFDRIQAWTQAPTAPDGDTIRLLLNAWNDLNDINTTLGLPRAFAAQEAGANEVYDKLFSADMAHQPDDWLAKRLQLEAPSWTDTEIEFLQRVMQQGLAFFDRLVE